MLGTNILVEANYREFQSRYKDGVPFAIISAFQGNVSLSQNKSNNITLRKKIIEMGYDTIRVIGHYQETDGVYESMVVFCKDPQTYDEFLRFLIFFAKKYYQNSIIVVDKEKNIWEFATKQGSTVGAIGSKRRYDKFLNLSNTEFNNLLRMFVERTYFLDSIRVVND